MKIFYCDCGNKVEVLKNVLKECACGKLFGNDGSLSVANGINMRKTWSHTTKVEFSETTLDKSVAKMNRGS